MEMTNQVQEAQEPLKHPQESQQNPQTTQAEELEAVRRSKKPRLFWLSNSFNINTGYAACSKAILPRLADDFEIFHVAQNFVGEEIKPEGVPFFVLPYKDGNTILLEHQLKLYQPDVLVIQEDLFPLVYKDELHKINYGNTKLLLYGAVDGSPVAWNSKLILNKADKIVAMSNFGKGVLEDAGYENISVIYHGVDTEVFKPLSQEEKTVEKGKLGKWLANAWNKPIPNFDNKMMFYAAGRNTNRKDFFSLFRAFGKFSKGKDDVVLVVNSINFTAVDMCQFDMVSETVPAQDGGETDLMWKKVFWFPAQSFWRGAPQKQMSLLAGMADAHVTCLLPDTLIETSEGLKPIKDVSIGDEVLTHKGRFRKVINKSNRYVDENIMMIKPFCMNYEVGITSNHPVLAKIVSSRSEHKIPDDIKTDWIDAGKLRWCDYLTFPKIKEVIPIGETIDLLRFGKYFVNSSLILEGDKIYLRGSRPRKIPKLISSNDFLELAGYYVAEGCYNKGRIGFCLNAKENEDLVIKEFLNKFCTKYDLHIQEDKNENHNSVVYWISSTILGRILSEEFGKGARNKKIPLWLKLAEKDKLITFMKAAWLGDGTIKEKYQSEYSTVSEQLANDLKLCLIKIGVPCNITKCIRHSNKWKKCLPENKIRLGHEESHWFQELLGKKMTYEAQQQISFQDSDYLYNPIRYIRNEHYSGFVFNLEVEEDQSYVTKSFVVHNCSLGEGFGMIMLESLACGVPVISNEYTTPKELVGINGERGFLAKSNEPVFLSYGIGHRPVNVDSMVEQMEKFYSLWKAGKVDETFEQNCLDFAKEHTWDLKVEEWKKELKDLLR